MQQPPNPAQYQHMMQQYAAAAAAGRPVGSVPMPIPPHVMQQYQMLQQQQQHPQLQHPHQQQQLQHSQQPPIHQQQAGTPQQQQMARQMMMQQGHMPGMGVSPQTILYGMPGMQGIPQPQQPPQQHMGGITPVRAGMMQPKQSTSTPTPYTGKKRGPKPKNQQVPPHPMQPPQQQLHHAAPAAAMPPPTVMLPQYIKPPAPIEEEPLADELDNVTARDLALTRYRLRHELMNEILGPVTIADLGAPPDPYFDVDVDAMERQAAELEKANAGFEKQSEARLREAKRRFESLTNGVAVE